MKNIVKMKIQKKYKMLDNQKGFLNNNIYKYNKKYKKHTLSHLFKACFYHLAA